MKRFIFLILFFSLSLTAAENEPEKTITEQKRFSSYVRKNRILINDNNINLMWTKQYAIDKTWREARNYCTRLIYAGYGDWRLPTLDEMKTLIDKNYAKPATTFPDMPSISFWTNDSFILLRKVMVWNVDFTEGYILEKNKNHTSAVRCVR